MGDYAASIGTTGFDYAVRLRDGEELQPKGAFRAVNGVRFEDIHDGLSSTILVGDKHVPFSLEATKPWDCGMWDGHNIACSIRPSGPAWPLASSREDLGWDFGSRHPGVVQFVFADGSVRPLKKSIDPMILGLLADIDDSQPIPEF